MRIRKHTGTKIKNPAFPLFNNTLFHAMQIDCIIGKYICNVLNDN